MCNGVWAQKIERRAMGEKKLGDIFSHFDTKHECYTSVNGKCRDYAQRGAVKIEFVDNFSF